MAVLSGPQAMTRRNLFVPWPMRYWGSPPWSVRLCSQVQRQHGGHIPLCILQVIYLGYNLEEGKQMLSHDYFIHPAKLPHKEKKKYRNSGGQLDTASYGKWDLPSWPTSSMPTLGAHRLWNELRLRPWKRLWNLPWPWSSKTLLNHSTCMWMRPGAFPRVSSHKPWDPGKGWRLISPRDLSLSVTARWSYKGHSCYCPAGKRSWLTRTRSVTDNPMLCWDPLKEGTQEMDV